VSDPWRSLKIKQFEQVTAGPSVALMRITGKASWRGEATPDQRPTLVADDGREVARFTPLSSPPDDRGVLRAAYSVPERLITAETVFSLELKDGHVIALPAPASRAGSRAAATPPPDVTTPPPPAPAPAADEALRRELADANRRAEEALLEAAAAHDQREELEQRNADLAESLRERQAALDELEVWCGELERRLASMSSELGDATARLRAAEEELEELRPEPAAGVDPPEGLEDLRRRAAAEAGEVAARELAEAAAERPGPGL
jgi:hypothetical protein